jgi:FkbM family methyltransferase
MSFKTQYLKDKGISKVLHIGAHTGEEIKTYSDLGVSKVVWVEANPEIYIKLVENINANSYGIENITFNNLITDKDDVDVDFHLYYYNDNTGMSSILKMTSGMAGKLTPDQVHEWFYKKTLTLKSITLNTFLERNNLGYDFELLNMDTQGAELLIAKGGSKVLENVKYINSEITLESHDYEDGVYFDELYNFFKQYGFKHIASDLSGDGTWGDALFVKEL